MPRSTADTIMKVFDSMIKDDQGYLLDGENIILSHVIEISGGLEYYNSNISTGSLLVLDPIRLYLFPDGSIFEVENLYQVHTPCRLEVIKGICCDVV